MSETILPNDAEKEALCDLMAAAFIELRYLDGQQAKDLAYAFHNLPKEIYGWGKWSVSDTRESLENYQRKHKENIGTNYVELFNKIFPK